jgi:DNA polymerase III subunit epsilon
LHHLDFTAIDFETANPNAQSACQLGLAVVKAGEIVERKSWLIRPPTDRFDFTYIHGITWHHVAGEPDFGQLWLQIRPYLENRVIAAHNAPFDLSVFFALIKLYRIEFWRGGAIDSVTVARRTWPWLSNHQLQTVASHLSIPLDRHDAASDANACAEIICRAEKEKAGVVEKAIRWYGER